MAPNRLYFCFRGANNFGPREAAYFDLWYLATTLTAQKATRSLNTCRAPQYFNTVSPVLLISWSMSNLCLIYGIYLNLGQSFL